jgi:ectoine hydroxylase-related dioxygenase (phytanoyl-CoA dioxygenase family)
VDATGDSTQAAAAVVDEGTVARFRRDGYVVVDGLLGGDELDRLAPAVRAAVARRKAADTRSLGEKSRYEQSFLQCQNLWEDSEDVRPLTFHPRVGQAAAALLGEDAVRLWHDQALFKEPGGRETDPHQDQPYWPIVEPRTITAWIPLHDVGLDGGCMGYVPGSHALGLRRFVDIFSGSPEDLLGDPALSDREPVFVEVPRGSVAFHHGLTAHLARPNRTGGVREVHTVIYFADGCTRSPQGQHPAVDRAGIEPGAAIRSDVTPVVWPRDPGEPVTTPPPIVGARTLRRLGILPSG